MRPIRNLLFLPITGIFIALQSASAGGSVENGGVGVVKGNLVYLLDLAEQGVESAPFITDTVPVPNSVKLIVERFSNGQLTPDVELILEKKISRMAVSYPYSLYRPVLDRLNTYELVFLKVPLNSVSDVDTSLDGTLVQIAVNAGDNQLVQVVRAGFDRLDTANQAALILHELIYASAANRSSRLTRSVTAQFFNPLLAADKFADRWNLACKRRADSGTLCSDRLVMTIAPDLIAEFAVQHQLPFNPTDSWPQAVGNGYLPYQLFATESFSGNIPPWIEKPGCFYGNYSSDLTGGIPCVDTPVIVGSTLTCHDASGGTVQVYHTDSTIEYIVKYDHVDDGYYGHFLFSGYAFIGQVQDFKSACK